MARGIVPLVLVTACSAANESSPSSEGFTLVKSGDEAFAPPSYEEASLGYAEAPVRLHPEPRIAFASGNYASTFDLRQTSKLTAVRDQGACGACWTFATYASTESGLLPGETTDMSEQHLNNAHGFDIAACNGGNSNMAIAYMSRWTGPVAEKDAPYTGKAQTFTKALPLAKHLTEAYVLADRAGPTDNDAIKQAVGTFGAVYTTMNWQSAYWNSGANAYYRPGPVSANNHAVAIVGWNDTFPATSFASKPPGDGAFIVRNSWGTSFGDAGYFYISYYDVFVGRENVVFAAFDPTSDYDGVYQYDSFGQTNALSASSSTVYEADIFTASAVGQVKAVSFYTSSPSSSVSISVYDAPTSGPASGTLLGTINASEAYAGYHTVSVASLNAKLAASRKFSVVVAVNNGQSSSKVPIEYPYAGYSSKVVAKAGTSFISTDGKTWTDTASAYKSNVLVKAFWSNVPSCDDGNACTTDSWNGTACTHVAVAKGTVCRASGGACDVAEVCDGTGAACPADAVLSAGTVCRSAAGVCDRAETCDGKAKTCPTDAFLSSTTVCRASAGACDVAELCTGKAAACPADALRPKGYQCSASPKILCSGSSAVCK